MSNMRPSSFNVELSVTKICEDEAKMSQGEAKMCKVEAKMGKDRCALCLPLGILKHVEDGKPNFQKMLQNQ